MFTGVYFPGKLTFNFIEGLFRFKASITRLHYALPYLLKFTLFAPFIWLHHFRILFLKKGKIESAKVVIILGHWRTASTTLQKDLSRRMNYATCNIYSVIFPEHFTITERWLKKPMQYVLNRLGAKTEVHNIPMLLDDPGEEEIALTAAGSRHTPGRIFLFPKCAAKILDPDGKGKWIREYKKFCSVYLAHSGKNGMVLKSPCNGMFLPQIIAGFPNAKFVLIEREKSDVLRSTVKMWDLTNRRFSFHPLTKEDQLNCASSIYELFMQRLQNDLPLIGNRLVKVRFEDYVRDPEKCVDEIIKALSAINRP
ncbi:MAG TPA: sulfotransferase [Chitinophagales bacterium]|nr:sulfotransferase [Chitinophagales bacterium]